uniref:UBR-type domain-containing protein n=1 Tax=Meloidogyne incognita TaxID=6306 RepID=A0A914MSP2_MELIC
MNPFNLFNDVAKEGNCLDIEGTIESIVEDLVDKICLKEDTKEEEKQQQEQQSTSNNNSLILKEECLQLQVGEFLSDAISLALEDFVGEENARAKDAEALLGGCLDLVCTYPEGYKPRQPLYSCKTCSAQNGGQLAGVCYACCENCHEGHDLVELYTKRNFCCDCGNSKFGKLKCKLFEEKDPLNQRNIYNDNFKGIFCVCKKPYPPEEEEEEGKNDDAFEDMVQCQICEDWFHPSHAISDVTERSKLDREREEEEDGGFCLICSLCIQKLPWLVYYSNKIEGSEQQNCCKLELLKNCSNVINKGNYAICFPINWRDQLCRCNDCKILYEDSDCQYLLEVEDTLEYFENQSEQMAAKSSSQDDRNKKMKQVEDTHLQRELALKMTTGIEQMKRHCIAFFSQRSASKRNGETVITKEDVADCFHELMVKRQKLMEDEEEIGAKKFSWTE